MFKTNSPKTNLSVGADGGGSLAGLHLLGGDVHADRSVVGPALPDEDVLVRPWSTAATPPADGAGRPGGGQDGWP